VPCDASYTSESRAVVVGPGEPGCPPSHLAGLLPRPSSRLCPLRGAVSRRPALSRCAPSGASPTGQRHHTTFPRPGKCGRGLGRPQAAAPPAHTPKGTGGRPPGREALALPFSRVRARGGGYRRPVPCTWPGARRGRRMPPGYRGPAGRPSSGRWPAPTPPCPRPAHTPRGYRKPPARPVACPDPP